MRRLREERQYVLRQRKKYFEIAQFNNNNTTTTIDLHLDACNCRSYCAARVRHRQHSPNSLSLSIAIVGVWGVPCRDPGVPCLDPGVFPGIGLPTGVDAALKASSRAFVRDRKRSIRAPASAASSAFRVNFSRSVWRLAIDSFHRASRSTTCFLIFSRLCSFFLLLRLPLHLLVGRRPELGEGHLCSAAAACRSCLAVRRHERRHRPRRRYRVRRPGRV